MKKKEKFLDEINQGNENLSISMTETTSFSTILLYVIREDEQLHFWMEIEIFFFSYCFTLTWKWVELFLHLRVIFDDAQFEKKERRQFWFDWNSIAVTLTKV